MMIIDETLLGQVTQDVCSGMLGFSLNPPSSQDATVTEWMVGSVRVTGEAPICLEFMVSLPLAQTMACEMFQMQPDEISSSEVHDAVGEIANMIGGNIKGMNDEDCNLSLPCVGLRMADEPEWHTGRRCVDIGFSCDDQPLVVRLISLATDEAVC